MSALGNMIHINDRIGSAKGKPLLFGGKKIVFFHLPKTAGTTLYSIIASQCSYSQIAHISADQTLRDSKQSILNSILKHDISFASGHFLLHELLKNDHISTITILRDPVARLKSLYRWLLSYDIRTATNDTEHNLLIQAKTNSPLVFFQLSETQYLFSEMCCFYGGTEYENQRNSSSPIETLNSIDYVGTTENMSQFCNYIAHSLGFPPTECLYHTNKTDHTFNFPNQLDDLLHQKLQEEIRLYEHAKTLFNAYRLKHIRTTYIKHLDSTNCSIIFDSNWHPWEQLDERSFRWSHGTNESKFFIFIHKDEHISVDIEICFFSKAKPSTFFWTYGCSNGAAQVYNNRVTMEFYGINDHDIIEISATCEHFFYNDNRNLGFSIWLPTIFRN